MVKAFQKKIKQICFSSRASSKVISSVKLGLKAADQSSPLNNSKPSTQNGTLCSTDVFVLLKMLILHNLYLGLSYTAHVNCINCSYYMRLHFFMICNLCNKSVVK